MASEYIWAHVHAVKAHPHLSITQACFYSQFRQSTQNHRDTRIKQSGKPRRDIKLQEQLILHAFKSPLSVHRARDVKRADTLWVHTSPHNELPVFAVTSAERPLAASDNSICDRFRPQSDEECSQVFSNALELCKYCSCLRAELYVCLSVSPARLRLV